MLVGPVFSVELVTSARRTRYFVVRTVYGLTLLAILGLIWIGTSMSAVNSIQAAADYASRFRDTFAYLQMVAVLLLGPALTAGAIAQERERRTIEYLFTTHLTNTEIVLSKLTAALVQLSATVAVGVPILAIAMLMGGISPDELAAIFWLTLSTLVGVVGLSMVASVHARRARDAIARVYVVLFLLTLGPLLISALLRGTPVLTWVGPLFDWAHEINPFVILSRILDPDAAARGIDRWSAVRWFTLASFGLTLLCVAWSAWAVRRFHPQSGSRDVAGKDRKRFALWRPKLGQFPLVWKELTTRRIRGRWGVAGQVLLWLLVLCAIGAMVWQFADAVRSGKPRNFLWFSVIFGTILEMCGLLLVAAWASNAVAGERENETWLMLISTPMTGREIVAGKLLGSIHAARLALLPLPILWVLSTLADPGFASSVPFSLAAMILLAVAASALGMLFSLYCQTSARALGATLGVALGAMVAGAFCCCVAPHFLLVMPGMVYIFATESRTGAAEMSIVAIMYGGMWAVGMAIYAGVTFALWTACLGGFDRLAGRTHLTAPLPKPVGTTPFSEPTDPYLEPRT